MLRSIAEYLLDVHDAMGDFEDFQLAMNGEW